MDAPKRSAMAAVLGPVAVINFLAPPLVLLTVWPYSPTWAVLAALLGCLAVPLTVGVECAMLYAVNRGDTARQLAQKIGVLEPPVASAAATLRAGWHEAWLCWRVFGWRQAFKWDSQPNFAPEQASGAAGVVFIHGFFCNRGLWLAQLCALRERGVACMALNLEPIFGGIDDYASAIDEAVSAMTQRTGRPPILVCHSMGGLAARAWLRTTHASRVATVITIGTPHHGTWAARFSHAKNGQQMQLQSPWLAQLEADERPRSASLYAKFVCMYSCADNIVFPTVSAVLPHARVVHNPGLAHVALAYSAELDRLIQAELNAHSNTYTLRHPQPGRGDITETACH